ncbi:MAG TPA: hypothetical protein DF613_07450, partial [Lachnospiraceae bacterium]|nr:hypothetical protein [Lachnospiraceae bacterium]
MEYIWPIALIVFSNIVYQICAKSVPKDMNTMASMVITYLVGAVCSAVMFFALFRKQNLITELRKINFATVMLGVSVVGLEVGFIYAYKAGWSVSTASTVQSVFLAAALIGVGAILYHEAITPSKVIGVV